MHESIAQLNLVSVPAKNCRHIANSELGFVAKVLIYNSPSAEPGKESVAFWPTGGEPCYYPYWSWPF